MASSSSIYGTDIDAVYDLPLVFGLATGLPNLGNALARRLSTSLGALTELDPQYGTQYGFDLRQLLNSTMSPGDRAAYETQISAECEKDERVLQASTIINFVPASSSATVSISIQTATGPFNLILAVTAVSVAILQSG